MGLANHDQGELMKEDKQSGKKNQQGGSRLRCSPIKDAEGLFKIHFFYSLVSQATSFMVDFVRVL